FARLSALADGIAALQKEGYAVEAAIPSGAIYLSARFALTGRRTKDGVVLARDEDVRSFLLKSAGLAAVPFGAFGQQEGTGWFRLSVGAVALKDIRDMLLRRRKT